MPIPTQKSWKLKDDQKNTDPRLNQFDKTQEIVQGQRNQESQPLETYYFCHLQSFFIGKSSYSRISTKINQIRFLMLKTFPAAKFNSFEEIAFMKSSRLVISGFVADLDPSKQFW